MNVESIVWQLRLIRSTDSNSRYRVCSNDFGRLSHATSD